MTLRLIINIGLALSLCATVQAQEVPPAVMAKIRAPIEAKYPNNFSMQKTLIDDQIASYRFLLKYAPDGIAKEVLQKMRSPLEARYPDNYSMVNRFSKTKWPRFDFWVAISRRKSPRRNSVRSGSGFNSDTPTTIRCRRPCSKIRLSRTCS